MQHTLPLAALTVMTIPAAIAAGCFDTTPKIKPVVPEVRRQVEEQIAIRICYGQYRSQADILRCLSRAL
jgi:hypothetical protein